GVARRDVRAAIPPCLPAAPPARRLVAALRQSGDCFQHHRVALHLRPPHRWGGNFQRDSVGPACESDAGIKSSTPPMRARLRGGYVGAQAAPAKPAATPAIWARMVASGLTDTANRA